MTFNRKLLPKIIAKVILTLWFVSLVWGIYLLCTPFARKYLALVLIGMVFLSVPHFCIRVLDDE